MGDIPTKEWGVGTHRLPPTAYRLPPTAHLPPPTAHRPPPTSGFSRLERLRENGSS